MSQPPQWASSVSVSTHMLLQHVSPPQPPQLIIPPQPSSIIPQSIAPHVAGVHMPHWLGVPPPPQVSPPEQVPQL